MIDNESRIKEIKLLNELIEENRISNALVKITIPKKFSPKLFNYCEQYGVDPALLIGGVEGAVEYANVIFNLESFERDLNVN